MAATTSSEASLSPASPAESCKMPRRVSESLLEGPTATTKEPPMQPQHFPYKLYDMLEHAAESGHGAAVSWVEDGRAFAIRDKESFLRYLVPMFFKQTKYRSFTRQLNLWGFERLPLGKSTCGAAWCHPHFVRGNAARLKSIERVEVKGAGKAHAAAAGRRAPGKTGGGKLRKANKDVRAASPVASTDDEGLAPIGLAENFAPIPISPPSQAQSMDFAGSMASCPPPPGYPMDVSHCQYQPHPDGMLSHETSRQLAAQTNNSLTIGDDYLFLLSGIFDSDESSSQDDDLCSILSLDVGSDDLWLTPIGL